MGNYLLGIDIGTSSCKATIFRQNGSVLATQTSNYNVYYPQPSFVEQNPMEWFDSVCDAVKGCLFSSNIDSSDISSVGIAGQSWSAIPIDRGGKVLHNTPIWMDTRANSICNEAKDRVGADRIFDISGNPFKPMYTTPKILWFKQHLSDVYKNTDYFLQSNSFIAFMLTGEISQDKSQGYGLHVYDISEGKYDEKLADELGIDLEKLPPISECHDVVGVVTEKAAMLTGLKAGTPVVAGGLDAACGTLGAGVISAGQTQEQGGQSGGMSICIDKPVAHEKLILSNHVVQGKWLLQGGTVGGGGSLNWFNRELGLLEQIKGKEKNTSAFEIMSQEASDIAPGAEGLIFLPYMAGERSPIWDDKAKGVFFGLSYSKTRKHMIRAIMEGVAYSLKHNIDVAYEAGANIEVFNSMGGAANSKVWTQIKADVTGIPVNVANSDTATTWGAAILAGQGVGMFDDLEDVVNNSISIKRTHEPNMENHKAYKKYYEIYLELYDKLKDTMERLG